MWIAGIVQAQAQAKGTKTKSLWKQHQLAEQACKTAWLVHTILQPADHSGALTLVTGLTPEGTRQEFHTRYLLEKVCLEEVGCQFSQVRNTPLLQNPILQCFGEIGTNCPAFKQVLSGTIDLEPQTDNYIKNCSNTLVDQHGFRTSNPDHSRNTQMNGTRCGSPPPSCYWAASTLATISWPAYSTQILSFQCDNGRLTNENGIFAKQVAGRA